MSGLRGRLYIGTRVLLQNASYTSESWFFHKQANGRCKTAMAQVLNLPETFLLQLRMRLAALRWPAPLAGMFENEPTA